MKEELLNYLKSPVWWATVILASFIVNLISAYSKDAIDKFVPKLFEWQRIRKTHREKNVIGLAKSEADTTEKVTYLRLLQIRHFQNFALSLFFGFVSLMSSVVLPLVLGMFSVACAGWAFWLSIRHVKQVNLIDEVIQKARSKPSEAEEPTSVQK